jgi:hypothetical protein
MVSDARQGGGSITLSYDGLTTSIAARGPYVGEYLRGWKSSGDQLRYLLEQGNL